MASSSRGEKPDLEKEVTEIKGSRVRVHRGDLMKDRAKNNIKVLKESSKRLQIQVKKFIKEVQLDLDMNMEKMRVLSARSPSQEEVPGARPREVGGQSEERQAIQEEQHVRSARKKTTPYEVAELQVLHTGIQP